MSLLFPAILIGGPPQRGKSVLAYILSKLLPVRQVPCYLFRAAPDGEGNWFQEADRSLAAELRDKRPWDALFEEALDQVLAGRPLPFLVDAGGRPTPRQQAIFDHCTHAILLGQDERERAEWRAIGERYQLQLLAEVDSRLDGVDAVISEGPPLQLRLCGLTRGRTPSEAGSPAWQRLAESVAAAIGWDDASLWRFHRAQAPVPLALNLDEWLARHATAAAAWDPAMLPALLATLPSDAPLAAYGGRPVWLPAALAVHVQAPLFCFDARYGWLALPTLRDVPVGGGWTTMVRPGPDGVNLSFTLRAAHLPPASRLEGPLPAVPQGAPVVVDGKLPGWLFAALARHYAGRGHTVAVAVPQAGLAVLINGATPGGTLPWRPSDE